MRKTFTSESVCAGHPDKICDQISDAILDEALIQDKYARVAIETLVTKDYTALAGEVTVNGKLDYQKIARNVIKHLGYTDDLFNYSDKSPVIVKIHTQSKEIAAGVDKQGAGDQGMMFGYACLETSSLMPLPITIAHALTKKIDEVREKGEISYLRPDGKAQVTISYVGNKPKAVECVVLAVPHKESVKLDEVKYDLLKQVVLPVLKEFGFTISKEKLVVNGTGVWHIGGPAADTGVTGRKIVVDTYGGMARVGGGCFSGKDPTKVDRSAAYAARFLAKNIVAAKYAKCCEVRLAYFIGAIKPVMQDVETFGTEKKSKKFICDFMNKILDTSVSGILKELDLRRPLYLKSAAYGHFGREGFPWEKVVV